MRKLKIKTVLLLLLLNCMALSESGTNYNNRFYMSRSYNAGGYDDAGYIPSSDHINVPYWDMSIGRTSTVRRIYTDFRSL